VPIGAAAPQLVRPPTLERPHERPLSVPGTVFRSVRLTPPTHQPQPEQPGAEQGEARGFGYRSEVDVDHGPVHVRQAVPVDPDLIAGQGHARVGEAGHRRGARHVGARQARRSAQHGEDQPVEARRVPGRRAEHGVEHDVQMGVGEIGRDRRHALDGDHRLDAGADREGRRAVRRLTVDRCGVGVVIGDRQVLAEQPRLRGSGRKQQTDGGSSKHRVSHHLSSPFLPMTAFPFSVKTQGLCHVALSMRLRGAAALAAAFP